MNEIPSPVLVASQSGWPCPSYRRVCLMVRDIAPSLMVLVQQGQGAQRGQFDLIVRREAQRPNEMWQADHAHLKIWVLDEEGQPVRPWLTVVLDDYSWSVCGFRLTVSALTALHSALTLRQAILRKEQACWQMHGIPKVFYTDHGRDLSHLSCVPRGYGSPRIHAELRSRGIFCSRERTARLMREMKLCTKLKRTRQVGTRWRAGVTPAPNLLNREFMTTAPNRKWVSHTTFIRE